MSEKKIGVAMSYMTMAINIIAGIIYVPLLLNTIGQKEYGLYQLIGGMTAYVALFDFGLSNTVTRFYVRYKASGDKIRLENMLAMSRMIFWVLTIICACIMVALYFNLQLIFPKLQADQLESGRIMFILLTISFCATIPTYVCTAVSNAEEKFFFLRGVSLASAVLQPICVILAVLEHPSAVSVTAVHTILNVILCIVKTLYVKFNLKTKFKFHGWDMQLLKSLFSFSIFVFINTIINEVNWQTGKTILGIMNGDTTLVTVLSIGLQLGNYYMMFSSSVNSVFYTEINRSVISDPTMKKTNAIFLKIGRIQAIIMGLILSGFIIFGREFVDIWAGAENEDAFYIALALMAVLFIPMTENSCISIMEAQNLHRWRSLTYLILSVVNVGVSIALVGPLGVYGVALGTVVSFFLGNNIIINIIYKVKAKINVEILFKFLFKFVVIIAILAVPSYFINRLIIANGYLILLAKILVYAMLYCILVWFAIMNKYEKGLVIGVFKRIFSKKHNKEKIADSKQQSIVNEIASKSEAAETVKHIEIHDKSKCCGCGACDNICPINCIAMIEDEEGFLYPVVDEDKCINCGLCKTVCMYCHDNPVNSEAEAYACFIKDNAIRLDSSSGGVFSALAMNIIEKGGVVYGAKFDKEEGAKHVRVESVDCLEELRGSKYVQSSTGNTFSQVKQDLSNDRYVLFTGTPCQINGLMNFLRGGDYAKLICVDLICHGVPSKAMLRKYIEYLEEKYKKTVKMLKFRSKINGWENFGMEVIFADDSRKYFGRSKDYYLKAFLGDILLRKSCLDCASNNFHNRADITIADYWGINRNYSDINDDKGVSAVLVRTEKGEQVFEEISSEMFVRKTSYQDVLINNKALETSKKQKGNRVKFVENMRVMDFDRLVKTSLRKPLRVRIRLFFGKIKGKIYSILKIRVRKSDKNR